MRLTNKSLHYLSGGLQSESNKEAPDISENLRRKKTGTVSTAQFATTALFHPSLALETPVSQIGASQTLAQAAPLPPVLFLHSRYSLVTFTILLVKLQHHFLRTCPPGMAAPNRPAHTSCLRLQAWQGCHQARTSSRTDRLDVFCPAATCERCVISVRENTTS